MEWIEIFHLLNALGILTIVFLLPGLLARVRHLPLSLSYTVVEILHIGIFSVHKDFFHIGLFSAHRNTH
jgi:hypothetical protein